MKFSPCGWFCFEEPAGWIASDTTESILLNHPPSGALMEITSARKEQKIRETEIWDMLENSMAEMPGAPFEETSMFHLDSGADCLKSVQAQGPVVRGMAFVFWSCYCVQVKLSANTDPWRIDDCIRGLSKLLEGMQPLTTD
jgi:hypothetical protein